MLRSTCVVLALLAAGPATAQTQTDPVRRGDYLVNHVSLCGDCHSPHGDHGQVIPGKEFTGATIRSAPLHPVPNWGPYAPALRGLPSGYTQASFAALLETGRRPNGSQPGPPMPPFRFDTEDAQAVAAYLASLK